MTTLIETLATIRPSSTFLSIKGYTAATSGEKADHTICFHMSYQNALEKSIAALNEIVPADDIEAEAKAELLASYGKSLEKVKSEPLEVVGDHYERIVLETNGQPLRGVKVHRESGELHIFGLAMGKTVLIPGTYKAVKSNPVTLAKAKLKKGLPVDRFRQFVIKPGSYEAIRVERMEVLPE